MDVGLVMCEVCEVCTACVANTVPDKLSFFLGGLKFGRCC